MTGPAAEPAKSWSPSQLSAQVERYPINGAFTIARGSKTEAEVVVATISDLDREGDAAARGWAESVPYGRYDETPASVLAQIDSVGEALMADGDRVRLQSRLPPGAARNALDCALWDLQSRRMRRRVWSLAGLPPPRPVTTAFTLSLAAPEIMAAAARAAADRPILKLKLGGADDIARVAAVRAAAPRSTLLVDANEALDFDTLRRLLPELRRLGVALIEQPLKAGADDDLKGFRSPVPLFADESLHTRAELADCVERYDGVNIKLDKAGGLTEAIALMSEARALGLQTMVGCMVATSLSMAPALLLASQADFVDLDGPLLLAEDRTPSLIYCGSVIEPPPAGLWG